MITRRTDAEIKKALKELVVLCDTREQKNGHIIDWFGKNGVAYVSRGLETGDYSVELNGVGYEDEIIIERKGSLDELAENYTAGRERFEREFTRAKAEGTKVFLVIEGASWTDIFLHNYRSKLNNKSLIASLFSWQTRYNITVLFCSKADAGKIIHGLLYYWIRDRIKRG